MKIQRRNDNVRLEVQDNGMGIPLNVQNRLFERFYRVPGTVIQHGTNVGLGLGLFICKQLIEAHGGTIGVNSTVGTGSTFWITLPLLKNVAQSTES